MDLTNILRAVDHTLLSPTAIWRDIKAICDDGMEYGVASVCIPPCYVKMAKEYMLDKLPVCTVIGFPNGYNTTDAKVAEAQMAVSDGADELDMVINIGMLKVGEYGSVLDEIKRIKETVGSRILKVIIESCLLTGAEQIKMCELVTASGADFIKTSTGFSTSGATFDDVILMKQHVGPNVRIKAAGGISSLSDAERFLELGASRLGTSRIIKLLRNMESAGY